VTEELIAAGVAFLTRQENFVEQFLTALGFLSLLTPPKDPSIGFGAFSLNIVKMDRKCVRVLICTTGI
jgi:hypothetical protein